MVISISKETDLDPCGEPATEDLGALGLYDLLRETCWCKKAKTNLATELAALRDQIVKAKVDVVAEFRIIIDDTVPPTPGGDDAISDETIDSVYTVEQEVKDTVSLDVAQPTPKGLDAAMVSSVMDPTTVDGPSTVNLTFPDASPS
nr:hypothetical protein CFP56_67953 [Quercus suber]POF05624.1 hypothetical protein CFP56_28867 [Quercus suber]